MIKNISRIAAVGVVAAALIAGSASVALAANTPPATSGSKGPLYIFDNETTGAQVAAGTELGWNSDVVASMSTTRSTAFPKSAGANYTLTFIAPRGQEKVKSQWSVYNLDSQGEDSVDPNVKLSQQGTNGATTPAALKAAGGAYSLGVAFVKDQTVLDAYYTYIDITPGTGTWKFDTPASNGGGTTPPAGSSSGEIALEATTVAAQDGSLSLSVPSGAKATLGTATLVNQMSTSTGTLPQFSVVDQRVVSRKGWDLSASVASFAGKTSGGSISAAQFGTAPKLGTGSDSTGVVASAAQVAGSASTSSFPFASAPAGSGVGTTNLTADLKFVAPANAAADTYTSKMTLTLVSK